MDKVIKFFGYFKKYKKLFFIDFSCAFLMAVIDLIFPVFTQRTIDTIIPKGEMKLLLTAGIFLICIIIVRNIFSFIVTYWGHVFGLKVRSDMRNKLFRHMQKLSFSYYDNVKTGELISRVIGDMEQISELAHHGPEDVFIAAVSIIGSFILMINMNVKLTLIIFVILPIFIYFIMKCNIEMKKSLKRSRKTYAGFTADLTDNISGIRVIKAFGNDSFIERKFEKGNQEVNEKMKDFYKVLGGTAVGMGLFSGTIQVFVLIIGGFMIYNGEISVGVLVGFLLFVNQFLEPIKKLMNLLEIYQGGMAGFDRFLEILAIDPDIEDSKNAVYLENIEGDIEFKNVDFSYGTEEEVLKSFNLKIKRGENIAVVGESGAGKSTICSLIPRFYDVTDGEVFIDSINVKDIQERTLRENIGIVQQDTFLFNGTIAENIMFGKLNATMEEVIEAAKKANAYEFIMEMPDGFNSVIGERGIKLSGGQKQRISIARIFLKNPKILILDEATSALDNNTEKQIQKSLEELSKGRTSVTIAHRLTTVNKCDRIIVLGKDGILEEGNHETLMNKKGVYYNLYMSQQRENI